jgi:hypothetical protein
MAKVEIGKYAAVQIAADAVTLTDNWSLSTNKDALEVTAFGDTFRKYKVGLKGWTATVSGTMDRSDAQQAVFFDQFEDAADAVVALRLYVDTGGGGSSSYWYGSAWVISSSVTAAVADKITVEWEFQGEDTLYWASA